MKQHLRRSLGGGILVSLAALWGVFLTIPDVGPVSPRVHAQPLEVIPNQNVEKKYVGFAKCAACHFREYKDWQTTPHANAFKILPAKYKRDAECLKCHSTGISEAAVHDSLSLSNGLGVSCQGCHGPGEDHANYALSFVEQEKIFTEDSLKQLRSKIQRLALDQCIKCHTSKSHKPHPPFDREKVSAADQPSGSSVLRNESFFNNVHGGQSR
jgi:hypothetical protein